MRELGDKRTMSTTLYNLGMMVREVDGCDKAYPLLVEALEMQHDLGAKASLLLTILYFVDIAIDRQDFSRATRLLAAAETLRASLGLELAAKGRSKFEQLLSALHSALPLETFQYHWLQGALLSFDELVTLASKSV